MPTPLDPIRLPGKVDADDSERAARGLESYFVRQVFAEVRKSSSGGGLLDGGATGQNFAEMLDDALADKIASGRGIGLRKVFEAQLEKASSKPTGGRTTRVEDK